MEWYKYKTENKCKNAIFFVQNKPRDILYFYAMTLNAWENVGWKNIIRFDILKGSQMYAIAMGISDIYVSGIAAVFFT